MDSKLKEYLENLRTDLKSSVSSLEHRIKENADTSLASHEATRKQVSALGRMVTHLWKQVKGSDPPPPADDDGNIISLPGGKPMDEQLTDHDLTIAAMQGQVISVDAKVNTVKEEMATKVHVDAVRDDLLLVVEQVRIQNERQLKAMGLRPEEPTAGRSALLRFVDLLGWMVQEPEGRRFGMTMLGALTSFVTAAGTTYALVTGRLPLPTQSVPTVQVEGVSPVPGPGPVTATPKGEASSARP